MDTTSKAYLQKCLARYLLDNKSGRRLYFQRNPKQVAKMVDLMRQEQADRLAAMNTDQRADWFNAQRYLARGNRKRTEYLNDITQRLQQLEGVTEQ